MQPSASSSYRAQQKDTYIKNTFIKKDTYITPKTHTLRTGVRTALSAKAFQREDGSKDHHFCKEGFGKEVLMLMVSGL